MQRLPSHPVPPNLEHDFTVPLFSTLADAGALTDEALAAHRSRWLEGRAARFGSTSPSGMLWVFAWTAFGESPPHRAEAALEAWPRQRPLPRRALAWLSVSRQLPFLEALGALELAADRLDEAEATLRQATRLCSWSLAGPRPGALLGRALKRPGRTSDACAEYARVVTAWSDLAPRSTSVEHGRERLSALACER